jgi:hypothetical protein
MKKFAQKELLLDTEAFTAAAAVEIVKCVNSKQQGDSAAMRRIPL